MLVTKLTKVGNKPVFCPSRWMALSIFFSPGIHSIFNSFPFNSVKYSRLPECVLKCNLKYPI